jgi:3-hydroxybutyryl-CoA dehydrogenase
MSVETVAVIGSGTMGRGIAQVAAMAGCTTWMYDIDGEAVTSAAAQIEHNLARGRELGKVSSEATAAFRNNLRTTTDFAEAVSACDFLIEAVPEKIPLKLKLFAEADRLAPDHAVLSTNTSSLSVTEIAAAVTQPGRVIGMHFFNPVHIMKLVEVVRHDATADSVVDAVHQAAVRMGKDPIVVRDSPGFASSRLGVVLGLEAIRMVERGVAAPEDIDKALELGYGHPMGPLRLTDLVGLDVRLAIAEYLHAELKDAHYEPPDLLRRKVAAGELGKKTGKGFYEWPTSK